MLALKSGYPATAVHQGYSYLNNNKITMPQVYKNLCKCMYLYILRLLSVLL